MTGPLPETIDLQHLGLPSVLSAHWFENTIVDPGPESALPRLLAGLGDRVPERILLTHIHFDHAGATGALVERFPDVEVWVHERGARHMVDPTRLVKSARGVFGDAFDLLWGKVIPVPEERIRVLHGGEVIGPWRVAYTPGHAQHHVCFLHEDTGVAFTGDVTGIRIDGGPSLPPTPPPDIDPPAWHASLDLLAAWDPTALAYMHFGVTTDDVQDQILAVHDALDRFSATARTTDAFGMAAWIREWVTEQAPDAVDAYYNAGPFEGLWGGLARYWKQTGERARPTVEADDA